MSSASRSARRRVRIAAGAVVVTALTGSAGVFAVSADATPAGAPKRAPGAFDNALIARTALRYVGMWGGQACRQAHHDLSGQCKQFVNCVVALASGGSQWPVDARGDYQASLAGVGGVPVRGADAVEGDIIQVGAHDDDPALHTAIVLVNHHNGVFTVVDANWVGAPDTPELVGVHDYVPPADAQIWRLGTVIRASLDRNASPTTARGLPAPANPPALASDAAGGIAVGTVTVTTVATVADQRPGPAAALIRLWLDGHPIATRPVSAGGTATAAWDTAGLPDGDHHLAAQAVTADGLVSALGPELTLTVANTTPVVAVVLPAGPLYSGTIPITAVTGPTAASWPLSLAVDGRPHPSVTAGGPAAGTRTLTLDSGDLTPGVHQITVTATGPDGRTATSTPQSVTTTTTATGHRVTIDTTGNGHPDLIATDTAGRLLRYPGLGDGTFGPAQNIGPEHPHGTVTNLAAGHFTAATAPPQLLATWSDGTAHFSTFDPTGHLTGDQQITGPHWANYTRLISGSYTGTGATQLLGITADGHADLITIGPDAHTTATPVAAPLTPSTAATAFAAPVAEHTDALYTIAADNTLREYSYAPHTGFTLTRELGPITPPAPGTNPVVVDHLAAAPAVLVTSPDGTSTTGLAIPPDVTTPPEHRVRLRDHLFTDSDTEQPSG
jgi:hypothetical protein